MTVDLPRTVETLVRVVSSPDPGAVVLASAADIVAQHFAADCVVVFGVDAETSEVVSLAVHPGRPEIVEPMRLPPGFGITGKVAAEQVPAVLTDDLPRNDVHRALLGLAPGATVSRMCVPAVAPDGASAGVLSVYAQGSRAFTTDEIADATVLARLLALRVDLDRRRSQASERETAWDLLAAASVEAQEAERRRVAADLHDGVTQAIVSLAFHLSAAQDALDETASDGFAAGQLREAHALADLAVQEIRAALGGLHSSVLDDLGLAPALESLARSTPQLQVVVQAEPVDLPAHVATALYRIAQESLQNVVKHAHASRTDVGLARVGATVSLSVVDDGRGFTASTAALSAGGQPSRPLRAGGDAPAMHLIGGRLTVTSVPGSGTRVQATSHRAVGRDTGRVNARSPAERSTR